MAAGENMKPFIVDGLFDNYDLNAFDASEDEHIASIAEQIAQEGLAQAVAQTKAEADGYELSEQIYELTSQFNSVRSRTFDTVATNIVCFRHMVALDVLAEKSIDIIDEAASYTGAASLRQDQSYEQAVPLEALLEQATSQPEIFSKSDRFTHERTALAFYLWTLGIHQVGYPENYQLQIKKQRYEEVVDPAGPAISGRPTSYYLRLADVTPVLPNLRIFSASEVAGFLNSKPLPLH